MPSFSRSLEKALHQALALANERHQEYATLEHLLLALTDDQDAAAVLRIRQLDPSRLRQLPLPRVPDDDGDDGLPACF